MSPLGTIVLIIIIVALIIFVISRSTKKESTPENPEDSEEEFECSPASIPPPVIESVIVTCTGTNTATIEVTVTVDTDEPIDVTVESSISEGGILPNCQIETYITGVPLVLNFSALGLISESIRTIVSACHSDSICSTSDSVIDYCIQ